MFYLELVSGLRKGELVALLWDDLDIQNRTISVSKQYIKNPSGKLTLSRPKTETSVRRVSIPQEAVDLLIQEHEKHPENPYMFPSSTTGEMYYPDSVVKLHEKILKDAGLEHIRFHDLRHPYVKPTTKNRELSEAPKKKPSKSRNFRGALDNCFELNCGNRCGRNVYGDNKARLFRKSGKDPQGYSKSKGIMLK